MASDALPWSMRVEGPVSAGIVLVPSRKRRPVVDEAGVGEDVSAGQLDAITDRAAHPHARDGDVDVVALDALPAREREAVSRVDGLDRTVQAVRAAHAAELLLHEDARAECRELRPEAADVRHLALRRQHDEVSATGHEDGRGRPTVTLELVEPVAEDDGGQALWMHAELGEAVGAGQIEGVQIVQADVTGHRLGEETRDVVEVLRADEVGPKGPQRPVLGGERETGRGLVAGRVHLEVEPVERQRRLVGVAGLSIQREQKHPATRLQVVVLVVLVPRAVDIDQPVARRKASGQMVGKRWCGRRRRLGSRCVCSRLAAGGRVLRQRTGGSQHDEQDE